MEMLSLEEIEQVSGGASTLRQLQGAMVGTGFSFGWAGAEIGTVLGGPVGGLIGAGVGATLGAAVGAVTYLSQ